MIKIQNGQSEKFFFFMCVIKRKFKIKIKAKNNLFLNEIINNKYFLY